MSDQPVSMFERKNGANRLASWLRSLGESALNPVLLSGRPRWRGLEPLEGRVMLSGVTIITHGRDGDSVAPAWLTAMASAIVERTGSDTAVYNLRISASGGTGPAEFESFELLAGLAPSDPNSNGETIILLDWADASGFAPQNYHKTSSIAEIVTSFLIKSDPSPGISRPLAESPIHLIGHSRGTSVVSELAQQLGLHGVWVDQVTTLDPHPLNYFPYTYASDPVPVVFSNVVFADNYWRQDDFNIFEPDDVDGQSVAGAFGFELNESVLDGLFPDPGYPLEHSDVHLFYYGTMNLSPSAASEGVSVPASWYPAHGVSRNATGYHYSRIGGGDRSAGTASVGLLPQLGGSGTRVQLNLSGATWPSLIELSLNGGNETYTVGDPIRLEAWYADVDSGVLISYFLDQDTNPYNTVQIVLGNQGYSQAVVGEASSEFSTPNVVPGIYHVYARISDSDGLTRFLYAPSTIEIVAPPVPEAEVRGNGVVIVDGDTTSSTSDHTDFGSITQGGSTVSRTFTVHNAGTAALTTSSLTVPVGFTVTEGLSASIAASGSDTFTVRLDSAVLGTKSGQISFINNDSDENPYNFSITGTVNAPQVPEVVVEGNGMVIVDGGVTPSTNDHTDFGTITVGGAMVSRTFTVRNTGTAALTTSGLTVPAGFTVTEGLSASIAAGGSDAFTVRLDNVTLGTKSGQISFSNNDSGENPYNFSITGTVISVPQPTAIISSANKAYSVPGTNLKVTLKGAGSAKIWAGVGGAIDRIELTGTVAKSTVTITPVSKFQSARVGEIVVGNPSNPSDRTSLGAIVGKLVELTGGISITGGIKTLTLAGATNAASIVIGADSNIASSTVAIESLGGVTFTSSIPIKTFTTNYWLDAGSVASLTAPWIGTLNVKGSMEADVSVTNPWVTSSLKKLTVAGALRNVTLRSAGNMGAVTVGSITGSRILAGIHVAVVGAPSTQADFTGDYSLSSFTAKGSFSNSVLAASRILKVSLDSVAANAGGNKFGVYSREAPKSFKRGDAEKGYKLTPVVLRPTDIEPREDDDFEVRVI